MMQLLIPLGLLGLLSIVALIIIYVIRPNYLVKHINSTYIWKLSMKYKKRRVPTSTIRNILLFLCQLLILIAMTFILTQPSVVFEQAGNMDDYIAIIDSSTSMYTESSGETRFNRAVSSVRGESARVFSQGGRVSVIIADDDPAYLRERVSDEEKSELYSVLDGLMNDEYSCAFGDCDLDGAMELCEDILRENSNARIELYTDKTIKYPPQGITIKSVNSEGEWNAAILDAQTQLEDGYYQLTVQMATYGVDREVELNVTVNGANAVDAETGGKTLQFHRSIFCEDNTTKTIIFSYGGGEGTDDIFYYDLGVEERFYTYNSIEVYIQESDNLPLDDTFYVYGGLKEVLKVQYASGVYNSSEYPGANPFVTGALSVLDNAFSDRWDIQITELQTFAEPSLVGFDVYIFEHLMPAYLPTDGVVLLLDPIGSIPGGTDVVMSSRTVALTRPGVTLRAESTSHPLMKNVSADQIQVTSYHEIITYSKDYQVLMSANGFPMLLARDTGDKKTLIMPFSVHNSNITMLPEWMMLMYNIFDYFLPATVVGNTFDVNEKIEVNGRGKQVIYSDTSDFDENIIETFPTTLTLDKPGTYTFDVTTYFGKKAPTQYVFVRTPAVTSNIFRELDAIADPYADGIALRHVDDLLVYFAAALVALLFLEWWLQSRERR